MDIRKLGKTLENTAVLVIGLSLVWWYHYYSYRQGGPGESIRCLYSWAIECQVRSGAPSSFPAYEPLVFWAGAGALAAAIIIRSASKPS